MQYYSLNNKAPRVSFKEAVINGLAPDKGLYFPENIKPLDKDFYDKIEYFSNNEIAFQVIRQFVGNEIPNDALKNIIMDTFSFDFPLVPLSESISALELFHGPTMAFKDVGARFMARCLGYFNRYDATHVTILVATSGDTGGAVASGFLGVKGVEVIILYPKGKVTEVQEKQLTTLGQNIKALEVEGVFDDCQDMVKQAFMDDELKNSINLTSANSINVARWLPQMLYYFFAYKTLKNKKKKLVFSVPSGNYGNVCAGMMAQKLGLPVEKFIAAANANDIIPTYLLSGDYHIKPTIPTISNAMDVGNPSNFIRIEALHNNDLDNLRENLVGYSFTDAETRTAMKRLYKEKKYIADPHGAIGFLALERYLASSAAYGIFLETAHPIKFLDVIDGEIKATMEYPEQIQSVMHGNKETLEISSYTELKEFLLGHN